ncbi:MAG: ABC transporter ATP-binding protein [Acetobacteraceae bacterium]
MPALLEAHQLSVRFRIRRRHWSRKPLFLSAVDGIDLSVRRGTTFGLIGESGSGKSTAALAMLRLVHASAGSVRLDGVELLTLPAPQLRALRRRMQIIFQDPYSSLNPRSTVGEILAEPLSIQGMGSRQERIGRVNELIPLVGLRPDQKAALPHQLSGGQRQRVAIARALATSPDLLICDEPVSALDVVIQAQILNLLRRLQDRLGLTYLLISHDFGVIHHMCDEIAVMYLGRIVEQGSKAEIFAKPLHPYTRALLAAAPRMAGEDDRETRAQAVLQGDPPSPIDLPRGCRFAGRCQYVMEHCRNEQPRLQSLGQRRVACHRVSAEGEFV